MWFGGFHVLHSQNLRSSINKNRIDFPCFSYGFGECMSTDSLAEYIYRLIVILFMFTVKCGNN
jgi:hypothetical protein